MKAFQERPDQREKHREAGRKRSAVISAVRAARKIVAPIDSFPDNIDRNAFGAWLSGFVDGEGCFSLQAQLQTRSKKHLCTARLSIVLREDDADVLRLIRSYWQCGCLSLKTRLKSSPRSKPAVALVISATKDLAEIIVPHFDRFPLWGKKAGAFAIWREAVSLIATVHERPRRWPVGTRGCASRWKDEERQRFRQLAHALSEQKKYRPSTDTSWCTTSINDGGTEPEQSGDNAFLPGFG